jgi:hypothetical protein
VSPVRCAGITVTYPATDQPYPAGILSRFGLDMVEVVLEPSADGRRPAAEQRGAPEAGMGFRVQLWKLNDLGEGSSPALDGPLEMLEPAGGEGRLPYAIPRVDTTAYNRLGLVVVRVDADEAADAIGAYTLVLHGKAGT